MASKESRIITHMNEDHQLSLYAMVQSTLSRKEKLSLASVKNCKMTAISTTEAKLSYIACEIQSCAQKEAVMKFDPPMATLDECRPRIVEMHHKCLQPDFSWLLTEPLCRMILFSMTGLGYAYYNIDMQEVAEQNEIVANLFGARGQGLAYAVNISWMFGITAHVVEALYAAYLCKTLLKMKTMATLSWFVIISMVGYPMTSKILEFARIQKKSNEGKKK